MALSQDDVERIADAMAPRLVQQVRQSQHQFWIEPETHYQDHMEVRRLGEIFDAETAQSLKDLARAYRAGRSRFFVMFVSLVIVGAIAIAGYALFGGGKVAPPSYFPGKNQ